MKKELKLVAYILVSGCLLLNASCSKDDDDKSYETPDTYTFVDAEGNSTVSYNGQEQRLNMLSELVAYMKTANAVGVAIEADKLKKMYANDAYTWTDTDQLGLTGSSKQLKSKTAQGDVGVQNMFEAYMDAIALLSSGSLENTNEEYGTGGVWSNGSKSYLQSQNGIEYTQLIEKGLMCAVFMNQMTANYLVGLEMDDNTEIIEGKTYTEMQHHWDEAYGYFSSAVDYPANGTDRFWGKYASKREEVLGSATKIAKAFRMGRAAIDNMDYTIRDEQAIIIKNEMEKLCAGTAIYYLNAAKSNLTNPTILNHELSEAHAFIEGLKYGYNAIEKVGMKVEDIDMALAYIGDDFSQITIENLNKAIDLVAEKTGLSDVKDKL